MDPNDLIDLFRVLNHWHDRQSNHTVVLSRISGGRTQAWRVVLNGDKLIQTEHLNLGVAINEALELACGKHTT